MKIHSLWKENYFEVIKDFAHQNVSFELSVELWKEIAEYLTSENLSSSSCFICKFVWSKASYLIL